MYVDYPIVDFLKVSEFLESKQNHKEVRYVQHYKNHYQYFRDYM
jgi:hypothetical protein